VCYAEVVYLLRGKETQATVTKAWEVTSRGRYGLGEHKRVEIEYTFTDMDGSIRKGGDFVDLDSRLPAHRRSPFNLPQAQGADRGSRGM
jgi:hypothetical protein